jgi:hypothetical protein
MRPWIAGLLLASAIAHAAEITDRQTLVEAIGSVRASGVEIAYSDRLVKPWMRVRATPTSADPIEGLRQALTPYGLTLEAGPAGQWLVVENDEPSLAGLAGSAERPDTAESEPRPAPPIDEVKIVASRYSLFDRGAASDQFLTGEEIRLLPHIADDAFRAFHRLPGAAAGDFSAPFNLRGGAVDEVKVVLDGLELFEPYHMRTLFSPLSIVDPRIIDNAHVLSGGFTAEFGNHMSGVIDMSSSFAESEPVHELGVSFVNSFLRSSGALDNGGSYQVSARRGYLDLIADSVTDEGEELDPRYSDVFAKFAYPVSEKTSGAVHVLLASDNVKFADPLDGEESDDDSSLGYAWLTLDHEPDDRLLWKNVLFAGTVRNQDRGSLKNLPFESIDRFYDRDVRVSGLQSSVNLRLDDSRAWMFGARFRRLEADFDYHIDSLRQTDFANRGLPWRIRRDIVTSRDGDEIGAYARYRFRPTPSSTWELGLRWDRQTWTETDDDSQLSPRVAALFRLGERTDLRFGWGRYHQPHGIQDLQVEDGVTEYFPAERAEHLVLGLRHEFNADLGLQVELYQKRYSDLRPRFENVLDTYEYAAETDFDRIRVEPESAESRGLEITLRNRNADRFDWWLNYTWSEAEDVIEGVKVPRSWDQRHAVTGNLTWRGDKWTLSVVGRYHSGWPRTPLLVTSILDAGGALVAVDSDLSQRNRTSFDDYFRIDARLSRTVKLARGSFQYYFEIFNIFDTANECCVSDHDLAIGPTVAALPNIDEFLPIFPSFGFVWTFGPGAD